MQTFITSLDFTQSAKWLDNQRLSKQRVECLQILKALSDPNYGWQYHPAVNMWRGYEWSLWGYAAEIIDEWKRRGYKDTCWPKICELMDNFDEGVVTIPKWLTEDFCSNHRSILLGKALELADQKEAVLDKAIALGNFEKNKANFKNTLKANRAYHKACLVWQWYKSHNWTEQPAVRDENNKWPYIWTTNTNAISRCAAGP